MNFLTDLISKYKKALQSSCSDFKQNECSRSQVSGCICRKLAEIYAHIEYCIPSEYRKAKIQDFDGNLPSGKKVLDVSKTLEIKNKVSQYIYGVDYKEIDGKKESDLVNLSKMDDRYAKGNSFVIYGKSYNKKLTKDNKLSLLSEPTGKTYIASCIMTQAIWRKCIKGNKTETFNWISFPILKQEIINKTELSENMEESDWLCIDDISLPTIENEFSHTNFVTLFDSFLMNRMLSKKPTILICQFDIDSIDLSTKLGYSFQKLVSGSNTFIIRLQND